MTLKLVDIGDHTGDSDSDQSDHTGESDIGDHTGDSDNIKTCLNRRSHRRVFTFGQV